MTGGPVLVAPPGAFPEIEQVVASLEPGDPPPEADDGAIPQAPCFMVWGNLVIGFQIPTNNFQINRSLQISISKPIRNSDSAGMVVGSSLGRGHLPFPACFNPTPGPCSNHSSRLRFGIWGLGNYLEIGDWILNSDSRFVMQI